MTRQEETADLDERINQLEQQLAEAKAALHAQQSLQFEENNQGILPPTETWQRFREALDNLPEVLVIYDHDLRILYINQATEKISGRPVSDYIGKLESEVWPPEVYQIWQPALRAARDLGTVQSLDFEFQQTEENKRYLHITCVPLKDSDGNVREIVGMTEDLTERKQAEEASQESYSLLRGITETSANLIAAVDTDLKYIWFNQAYFEEFKQIFGVELKLGDSLKDRLAHLPEEQKNAVSLWQRVLQGETISSTAEFGDYSRTRKDYDMRFSPIYDQDGQIIGAGEIASDVTQRAKAEQALQESEIRYRSLFNNMSEGFAMGEAILDESGRPQDFRFLAVNDAFERQTGLHSDIIGQPATKALPQLEQSWIDTYCRVASSREPTSFRRFNVDTNRSYDVYCFSPAEGRFAILFLDVTENEEYAEALRASEERFRFVIENSLDVAYRRNLQTDRYDYMSPVVEQVLGFSAEEMNAMSMAKVNERIHPDDGHSIETALIQASQAGKGKLEYRFRRKDGEYVWIADHIRVVNDEDGAPLYRSGILRDITDKKNHEQALRELNDTLEERVRERTDALQCEIEERKQIEAELVEIRKRNAENLEEERRQLSQEVHDGAMQDLYALSYDISGLDPKMAPEQAEVIYRELQDRILEITNTLRQISRGLRPAVLDQFGLEKAIKDHIGNILRENNNLQVKLELSPDKDLLPSLVRLSLFRIFQTAVGNILRHSGATSVVVRLQLDEHAGTVVLEVQDNGKGFLLPQRWINLVREGHLGLAGANERAEDIGGQLQIITAPGQGTLIRVTAPLH